MKISFRETFPLDTIAPVAKGVRGADIKQTTCTGAKECGIVLWECKQTKDFSDGWLPKLREDQRMSRPILLSLSRPLCLRRLCTSAKFDKVWIASYAAAIPMAFILRHLTVGVDTARSLAGGMQTKAELLYSYLSGSGFRQRIESFVGHSPLCRHRSLRSAKSSKAGWAKRESQRRQLMRPTAGCTATCRGLRLYGLDNRATGTRHSRE